MVTEQNFEQVARLDGSRLFKGEWKKEEEVEEVRIFLQLR
jgi:hypothetical protein